MHPGRSNPIQSWRRRLRVAQAYWFQRCAGDGPIAAGFGLIAMAAGLVWRRVGLIVGQPGQAPALSAPSAASAGHGDSPLPLAEKALLIGYAEGALGLGEAFRGDLVAAEQAGLPFAIGSYAEGLEGRRLPPFLPERYDRGGTAYRLAMVEMSAQAAGAALASWPEPVWRDARRVVRAYWELPRAPQEWAAGLAMFDEMWAPNRFVAEAFAGIFAGQIGIVPPTLSLPEPSRRDRASFGLPPDRLAVIFTFDYFSYPARKNPLATIEAFQLAFPPGDDRAVLVVKSVGPAHHHPEIYLPLRAAAQRDPRIRIIDGWISRQDALALLKACDVYLSLHRSEGLGLGMAEAMAFGRVVVATGWSANAEFVTQDTGFPVGWTLRDVRPGEYPFHEGQVWAEPDIADAASALRRVADDPALARARADRGQALVRSLYDGRATGAALAARFAAAGLPVARA